MKTLYKNDPTEDYELIEDLNPQEAFEQSGEQLSDLAEQYLEYLHRKLKAKDNALKELHSELENNDKLTYYKNRIWKILKS